MCQNPSTTGYGSWSQCFHLTSWIPWIWIWRGNRVLAVVKKNVTFDFCADSTVIVYILLKIFDGGNSLWTMIYVPRPRPACLLTVSNWRFLRHGPKGKANEQACLQGVKEFNSAVAACREEGSNTLVVHVFFLALIIDIYPLNIVLWKAGTRTVPEQGHEQKANVLTWRRQKGHG